jgi:signal transduction histidine kinase
MDCNASRSRRPPPISAHNPRGAITLLETLFMNGGRNGPEAGRGSGPPSDEELVARESARRGRWERRSQRQEERERRREETRGEETSRLSPEEAAYREARALANRKIGFLFHFVPYAFTCLFLLMVAGFRAAFIVALSWGIGVACHAFAVIAPTLRKRMVDGEVARQLQGSVREERRSLAHEHVRQLEELSASIAHEIRNPITAAKSLVQQLGEDTGSPVNVEYARVALEELDRVERSISHLLRYAREEDLRPVETDLREVVEAALETVRERIARLGVRVERDLANAPQLRADPEKLRRVVINLVANALDALEDAGTRAPQLWISAGENLAGTEVWLRIRDNGPGMDPETRERAFRPFHTSKPDGTGLGLPIVKKLVEAHGGAIELHASEGVGTEFAILLPKRGLDGGAARQGN